jgi:chromosome partitioning protein
MNVIAFASRKGGTGKSTLAAHLAVQATMAHRSVLLIDADPQGSLSLWHEIRAKEQPALRRATRGTQEAVKSAAREGHEWAFIDTPPNLSASVSDAIRLATLVLIPCRASVFDLTAIVETIDLCRKLNRPYSVIFNAVPSKRSDAEAAIVSDARHGLTAIKAPVWSGQITDRSDYCFALGAGAGAREFSPDATAAEEISRLWSVIERSVKAINEARRSAHSRHASVA